MEDKLDGGQITDTGTFELVEEITVIPVLQRLKTIVHMQKVVWVSSFDGKVQIFQSSENLTI